MLKYKFRKARGFSLTEILITLIIIAVLSGMVMLTVGSNSEPADAARLAANLEALRAAVLAYSNEVGSWNRDAFRATADPADGGLLSIASLSPYLDRSTDPFEVIRADGRLLVGFPNASRLTSGVADKLAKRAGEGGLVNSGGTVYSGGTGIYVFVR